MASVCCSGDEGAFRMGVKYTECMETFQWCMHYDDLGAMAVLTSGFDLSLLFLLPPAGAVCRFQSRRDAAECRGRW